MSLSQTTDLKSQYFRVRTTYKPNCIDYLIDQDKADSNVKNLLVYLRTKYRFADELRNQEFLGNKEMRIDSIKQHLELINPKHRSYLKLRSIAAIEIAQILYHQKKFQEATRFIKQAICFDQQINQPHFLARGLLMQILCLYSMKSTMKQIQKDCEIDILNEEGLGEADKQDAQIDSKIIKQIQKYEKKFHKIKWNVDNKELELEERLWEVPQINQFLVYQYHDIIKNLCVFKRRQGEQLYQKGIQIAEKYLGQSHKLTKLLKNIEDIKLSNKKLLYQPRVSTSSRSVKFRTTKKSINHKNISQIKTVHRFKTLEGRQLKNSGYFYVSPHNVTFHHHNSRNHNRTDQMNRHLMTEYFGVPEEANKNVLQKIINHQKGKKKLNNIKKKNYLNKNLNAGKILHQEKLINQVNHLSESTNKIESLQQLTNEHVGIQTPIHSKQNKRQSQEPHQMVPNQEQPEKQEQELLNSDPKQSKILQTLQQPKLQERNDDGGCQLI